MARRSDISAGGAIEIAPSELPSASALLTLCVFVVIVAGLYFARDILIPVTLAGLLSFVLAPIASFLRSIRLGRVPSVLIAVFAAFAFVVAIGGLIGSQLADLAGEAPRYQYTVERKIEDVRGLTLERISAFTGRFGLRLDGAGSGKGGHTPSPPAAQPAQPSDEGERKPIPVEVHQPSPSPLELVERIVTPVVGPISTLAIVFVIAIFVLLQREDLRDRVIRLFGSRDLHRATIAMDETAERLSRFFLTQIAINAGFGVVVSIGLLLIGVPSPLLWGVIGALLRFVPYIGALLSALLPMTLAAAVDPGWTMVLWTMGLYLVVEIVTGQAIEPWAYGHSAGLSPISVVIAATFWTWLWGPIGLLLSTPLTLCLVVLGRHVERLAFLDVILGDTPPLTPVENFYQRMLAGDPDEAQDQAEQFLKEKPLYAYYDEVVVEGLRLAASDVERGALRPRQFDEINESVNSLIQDLADHKDARPGAKRQSKAARATPPGERPPESVTDDLPFASRENLPAGWRGEAPVLCVAGRGAFDEAASSMLAQLLARHGLGTRDVAHGAVSRQNIGQLEVKEVAMICVTSLESAGNVAHLRYLLRRLRQRLPNVPILVGLWPRDDVAAMTDRLRTAIDADHYAVSLREALETCLGTAGVDRRPPPPEAGLEARAPIASRIAAKGSNPIDHPSRSGTKASAPA